MNTTLLFFLVSFSSTLEVSVLVLLGMLLARYDFLPQKMTKNLSDVMLWVFMPCLLYQKVSTAVTWELLRTAWPILFFGLAYQIIGYLLARFMFVQWLWGKHRISDMQQEVLNCSVMFSNSNSLPFLFILAILNNSKIFAEEQSAVSISIAYMAVFLLPTRFTFWSYTLYVFKYKKYESTIIEMNEGTDIDPPPELRKDQSKVEAVIVALRSFPYSGLLKAILSPPVVGMLIGLLVGLVKPLRYWIVTNPPVILSIIDHITNYLGSMFPISMIILGTNLYTTLTSKPPFMKTMYYEEGLSNRVMSFIRLYLIKHNNPFALLISCFLKLVMMPIIAIGLVMIAVKINLISSVDPLLLLVLMLEGATPCPINLSVTANLCKEPALASSMSEVLLYQYLLSPLTMALFAVLFLQLSCSMSGSCNMNII